jgi:glucose-1-phosphate thymidylyltransferase
VASIVEKPKRPASSYVNTGLWMFQPDIFALLKGLKKSARGEYEVTDALATYARQGLLTYSILESAWTDAGSFESLYRATVLMKRLEDQQRRKSG